MQPFTFQNPTKLIFGKGQLEKLKEEVPKYGKNVLLVYGGGSIKRNGIYDKAILYLNDIDANIFELSGVEPNPRVSTVRKGVDICKTKGIELILAIGGGSTIDCSKAIAAGAKYDGDAWDIVTQKAPVVDALPLGTVLTIAATGSEMNPFSVITNWETNEKYGWASPLVYPKFSILDPVHTMTLPKNQTVYGIVDMMSHVFESYFHHEEHTPIQDRFMESILTTVMETAPKLICDLENYNYRETIMYAGTLALNGSLSVGITGDWATHNIEHAISAIYDIPHGAGLAILTPSWMKHTAKHDPSRMKQLAIRVFGVDPSSKTDEEIAFEGIDALRNFWNSIGAPAHLSEYNITEGDLEKIVDTAMAKGPFGQYKVLDYSDVRTICQLSL